MADDKDLMAERGRSLEAEYFRRKDQELLEKARELEAAKARERELAAALGVDAADPLVAALGALGFEPATTPLLEIVPAIQVAWADGTLPAKERAEIERLLARPELQPAAERGSAMVAAWLARQPGSELYRLATDALGRRVSQLAPPAKTELIARVIKGCNAVAAASGGVFGLGARSSEEADRIREIAAALGVEA